MILLRASAWTVTGCVQTRDGPWSWALTNLGLASEAPFGALQRDAQATFCFLRHEVASCFLF